MTSAIVVGAGISRIGDGRSFAVRVGQRRLGRRQLDAVPRLERQRNLGHGVHRRLADVLDVAQVLDEPGRVVERGKPTERRGAVGRGEEDDVFHGASLRRR